MTLTTGMITNGSAEWDAYVDAHPAATNYHRYAWKEVIEKSFGHRTYYLAVRDSSSRIRGLLPLAYLRSPLFGSYLVSLPFFNYGGLLCSEPAAADLLCAEARRILDGLRAAYAEFRHVGAPLPGLASRQHKVTMILDLRENEEQQWRALDAKVRNQVRKAEKCGLQAHVGHLELLEGFYDVFSRNMRDLGTPVYGKNFFRTILATFPATTRIISVTWGGKTVASGVLTWFRDCLEVPWASSIGDYRDKCPNNLLYWAAIKFALGSGARKFDFGRSTPGEGTYRFKNQWGARPVQLYWHYLLGAGQSVPELNPANPKYRLAIGLWKQLPVMVTKMLGPAIVKGIP